MREIFTWSYKEDDEIYKHGKTIMWVAGTTDSIQRFVEELSYKIGHKCDFAFTAGRAHIDVLQEGYWQAIEAIKDKQFMNKFIVPYSKESYQDGIYFEVLKM